MSNQELFYLQEQENIYAHLSYFRSLLHFIGFWPRRDTVQLESERGGSGDLARGLIKLY